MLKHGTGAALYQRIMMTNTLPFSYLSHLSKEIACGRALHAIAVANEYLAPAHPLRAALVQKAAQCNPEISRLAAFSKLAAGEKFRELDTELQQAVQGERAPRLTLERKRFSFNAESRRINTRAQVLERRGEPTARVRSAQVTELCKARRLAV